MGKRHARAQIHAGQICLSRRPSRAGGPAHERRGRARSQCRGKAQCPRAPAIARAFASALALAAIRETFEETGLAIGVGGHGAPESPPAGAWTRFAATGVTPALDAIDFLARAITPPGRPRRFDARFLIADARFIAKRIEGVDSPRSGIGRTRLDAAERSAEPRPSRDHAHGARRPRPSARRRPGQTTAATLLSSSAERVRDSSSDFCTKGCR